MGLADWLVISHVAGIGVPISTYVSCSWKCIKLHGGSCCEAPRRMPWCDGKEGSMCTALQLLASDCSCNMMGVG